MVHASTNAERDKNSKPVVQVKGRRRKLQGTNAGLEISSPSADDPCGTRHVRDFVEGRIARTALARLVPGLAPSPPFPIPFPSPLPTYFQTEHFSILYWQIGSDAVDPATNGGPILDPNSGNIIGWMDKDLGVPDYVQRIAFWLERSWSVFSSPPISMIWSYNAPIDVRIDQQWPPSWRGELNLTVGLDINYIAAICAHEVFHMFQDAYATYGGQFPDEHLLWAIKEGGADLAIDFVLDAYNFYISTERALTSPTQWSPFTKRNTGGGVTYIGWPYPFSMFLKYYVEQSIDTPRPYDDALRGGNALRILYENCHANGYGAAGMSAAASTLTYSHRTFAKISHIGGDVQSSETLLGNFWVALYLKDLPAAGQDRRFALRENSEGMPPLSVVRQNLPAGGQLTYSWTLSQYTTLPYEAAIDPAVECVSISLSARFPGHHLFQVVLIDPFGEVIDIFRSDVQQWAQSYSTYRNGRRVDRIYVAVISTDALLPVDLVMSDAAAVPDISITPWNCVEGTHFEVDPLHWTWTWLSPDIWLDNYSVGHSSGVVQAGGVNRLVIRLRNQGGADAMGLSADIDYQPAGTLPLDPNAWQPIRDAGGSILKLSGADLAAGQTASWSLAWSIPASLADTPIAVRVRIKCPSDPNLHNKTAMTILSHEVKIHTIKLERKLPVGADPLFDPPRRRLQIYSAGPHPIAIDPLSFYPVDAKKTKAGRIERFAVKLRPAFAVTGRRAASPKNEIRIAASPIGRPEPCSIARGSLPPGGEQFTYLTLQVPVDGHHGMGLSVIVGGPAVSAMSNDRLAASTKVRPYDGHTP